MRLATSSPWVVASAAATVALLNVPTVHAWGAAGHEIVATIAQAHLHPTVLSEVCNILNLGSATEISQGSVPCHLSRIAAWADTIKRQPQYRYTSPLHYVGALGDHPPDSCAFPGERGWAGKKDMNLLGAIRNTTNMLVEYVEGTQSIEGAEEALKFLVHYVGDVHQPLHLTGRDRGGNGAKVTFDGRLTSKSLLIQLLLHTPFTVYRPTLGVGWLFYRPGTAQPTPKLHARSSFGCDSSRCRISSPGNDLRPLCPSNHV